MFFNFFKTPQVRKFEHKPIYWDPEKEERQERRERIRQEVENELGINGSPKTTLKKGFLSQQRKNSQSSQTGVWRLALIIGLLVCGVIYMVK